MFSWKKVNKGYSVPDMIVKLVLQLSCNVESKRHKQTGFHTVSIYKTHSLGLDQLGGIVEGSHSRTEPTVVGKQTS